MKIFKISFAQFGLFLVCASANAIAGQSLISFSVVQSGGGQLEVEVVEGPNGTVNAATKSCSFKHLTNDESARTQITVTGTDASDAMAILKGQAILAEQHFVGPVLPTGTWQSLNVTFAAADGTKKTDMIGAPIVIIGSTVSQVLNDIESQASAANAAVCK